MPLLCSLSELSWWRHQMETFSALLAICAGISLVPGEFLAQRPVTWSFDVFFDLHPNKQLSKQWWGWWFETLSHYDITVMQNGHLFSSVTHEYLANVPSYFMQHSVQIYLLSLPDGIFTYTFLNKNAWVAIKILQRFVPSVQMTVSQYWCRSCLGTEPRGPTVKPLI